MKRCVQFPNTKKQGCSFFAAPLLFIPSLQTQTHQRPPLSRGLDFCAAKRLGESFFSSYFSPSVFAYGESTSLIRGRPVAAAELGTAKAF